MPARNAVGISISARRRPGSTGLAVGNAVSAINGGFDADTDWTLGTGWTIAGGVATKAGGVTSSIQQVPAGGPLVAGNSYEITFTIASWTGGQFSVRLFGGTFVAGTPRIAAGTYTQALVATPGNTMFGIFANATAAGTIDNISITRVAP